MTAPSFPSAIIASNSALKLTVHLWIGSSETRTVVSSTFSAIPVTSYLCSPTFFTSPLKPRHQGSMGTTSSSFIKRRRLATISAGLYDGMVVLQPVTSRSERIDPLIREMIRTCANTFRPIDQHHGQYRHVPLRFDDVVVLFEVIQERVVRRMEDSTSQQRGLGEDIPGRGMIFTTLITSTVLSIGL